MTALDSLYSEIIKVPRFRDAAFTLGAPYREYFVKLCRRRERRFLLRNEARIAERLSRYDFCPPFVGFADFEDASCLVYRRVHGVPITNMLFVTERVVALVSRVLDRVNEVLAAERICQLDPSPNNIIVDSRQGRVWYLDYELCAPFGTQADIMDHFELGTEEERRILQPVGGSWISVPCGREEPGAGGQYAPAAGYRR